jgi:hypothetical protein
MDPLTIGLLVGGTALQIAGRRKARRAEQQAHEQNAAFFRKQQLWAEEALTANLDIFDRQSKQFSGKQLRGIAKAGVDMSGSALLLFTQTKGAMGRERVSMVKAGQRNIELAGMKADQSMQAAKTLKKDEMFDLLGAGLGFAGSLLNMSKPTGESMGTGLNSFTPSKPGLNMEMIP